MINNQLRHAHSGVGAKGTGSAQEYGTGDAGKKGHGDAATNRRPAGSSTWELLSLWLRARRRAGTRHRSEAGGGHAGWHAGTQRVTLYGLLLVLLLSGGDSGGDVAAASSGLGASVVGTRLPPPPTCTGGSV